MSGNTGNSSSLSIDVALQDKASRFVEGFMLETKSNIKPKPVLIQVKPLPDAQGVISQIVFVMSEPVAKREEHSHESLNEAIKRKNSLLDSFSAISPNSPYESIKAKIGLITHIEEDIFLAQELEDHNLSEKPGLTDLVLLSSKMLLENRPLSDFLAVKTTISYYDPDSTEAAFVKLHDSQTSELDLSPSIYSLPIEKRFVGIIISKMIQIGLLLASSTPYKLISLDVSQDNARKIYLKILMPNPGLTDGELSDILVLNNPVTGQKTHLAFGSGLEGYLFKKLCTILNIPFQLQLSENGAKISLEISLDKGARTI
jgi:hypothetical protein